MGQTIEIVKDRKGLAEFCKALSGYQKLDGADKAVAIDTETYVPGEKKKLKNDALVLDRGRIMIITACHGDRAWFIPLKAYFAEFLPDHVVMAALRPYFEDPAFRKVFWNANYDCNMFRNHGIIVKNIYCGMVAGHVWDNELPMSLKERAVLVGMRLKKFATVNQANIEEFGTYAVNDAVATWKLYEGYEKGYECQVECKKRNLKLSETERKFFNLEMRALKHVIRMERAGMKVDLKRLADIDKEIASRMEVIKTKLYRKNGEPFNVASSQQLGKFLFEKLGLDPPLLTEKGKPSVNKLALIFLQDDHPLVRKVIDHNKLQALKKFVSEGTGLQLYVDERSRIHATIAQSNARTFRSVCSRPNLQQIPSKTDILGFRKSFIAKKGCKLIVADMDQLELRLMALASRDRMMLKAFRTGESIHIQTGLLCGLLDKNQTKEEMKKSRGYNISKSANFGLQYEGNWYTLQRLLQLEGIPISDDESKRIVENYWKVYADIPVFRRRLYNSCRELGHIKNICGRVFKIKNICSEDKRERAAAERQLINTAIQSSAAEWLKYALIRCGEDKQLRAWKCRMLMLVHDELIFEVPEQHAEEAAQRVKLLMETVPEGIIWKMLIPLTASVNVGDNWDCKH